MRGSTERRYQSLVTRMPRAVDRIISAVVVGPPSILSEPAEGVAINDTVAPLVNVALQFVPQFTAIGLEVTVPLPKTAAPEAKKIAVS